MPASFVLALEAFNLTRRVASRNNAFKSAGRRVKDLAVFRVERCWPATCCRSARVAGDRLRSEREFEARL
jgi:hypothetical protein